MNKKILWIAIIATSFMLGCDDVKENSAIPTGTDVDLKSWLVPIEEVYDGGPGKDGIPALSNPQMTALSQASYLGDNDLVLGFKSGNDIRAYPHPILNWHEIINDDINGISVAITYCPLTGSGIGWNRKMNGVTTTFGVSGLLYNANLIPYDRASDSYWSQMTLQCVSGVLKGNEPDLFKLVETSWKTWKELYPNSKVVSINTGFNRDFTRYPYGLYRTNDYLIFPVNNTDSRLHKKERVLGVKIGLKTKVYQISNFSDSIMIINDKINTSPVVIVGSKSKNFALAFFRRLPNGKELTFSPIQNALPVVMVDSEGTTYDIFGMGITGPRDGEQLLSPDSYIAYWFAWVAFHDDVDIY